VTITDIKAAVLAIVNGKQSTLFTGDLDCILAPGSVNSRDFIRQAFFDNGVEIEFSGKGPFEKGVVIDLDTDRMQELGLDVELLRFGQTVVRVEH
jgi:GDPmannose 4,6-dehydratase